MTEEMVQELFDVELVRLWQTDDEGNSYELPVYLEIPTIEVNICGDGQDWWVEGCNGIVERGGR